MRDSYEQGGDPYRFVIVAIFVFSSMLAGMAFNPLTPIANTAILIFKIGGDTIGLTTSICQVATVVLSLPAVAFAGKFGPKFSAIIGTLLISIGFSLRILINESIFFVLIGQVLAGFGGPFINNIQSIVINQWFNKKERGFWLALTAFALPGGTMLGFLLPILFISSDETIDFELQKRNMFNYLFFEAAMASGAFLLASFVWRTATEYIENDEENTKKVVLNEEMNKFISQATTVATLKPVKMEDLWSQMLYCFKRRAIRSLIILYSIAYAIILAIGSMLTAILSCFRYGDKAGPVLSCILIGSGVFGSIIYSSIFMRGAMQHKNMFVVTGFSAIMTFTMVIALVFEYKLPVIMGICCLLGLLGLNLNVLVLEELIRRLESKILVAASVLSMMLSQMLSAAMIYLTGFFIEPQNEVYGCSILTAYGCLFLVNFGYCFMADYQLTADIH